MFVLFVPSAFIVHAVLLGWTPTTKAIFVPSGDHEPLRSSIVGVFVMFVESGAIGVERSTGRSLWIEGS